MIASPKRLSNEVRRIAGSLAPRLKEVRRYLHQRPELSGNEYETSQALSEFIADLGLQPVFASERRGLWVDVGARVHSECRVVIRGDIDALPIQTEINTPYSSQIDHVMHACGHDAHAAMVWGAVAIIQQIAAKGDFPDGCSVRALFQPAEENSTGAIHMIESGALEDVAAAIALHVDPTRAVGTFGYRDGAFTAGCDTFTLKISGQSGHGARPHLTGDTIGAASSWVNDLYRRLPRSQDAQDPVVVSVGRIVGGDASNVVPGEVDLSGTLRTLSLEGARFAKNQMRRLTAALELTHPVQTELVFAAHTPPVINDASVNAVFRNAAEQFVDSSNVRLIERPSMGAEDFAFMAAKVPIAMMRIGVAGIDVGSQPLHTPLFDIDESALEFGSATLALASIELSRRLRETKAVCGE